MSDTTTITELLDHNAANCSTDPYLIDAINEQAMAYGDITTECRVFARQLAALGIQRGDTVSVFMPNGVNTAKIIIATMYAGYVVNPINLLCQEKQLAYILGHSDARIVFTTAELAPVVNAAMAASGAQATVIATSPEAPSLPSLTLSPVPSSTNEPVLASMPALLMYTSGTTGVPKGVVLTHANLLASARAIAAEHLLQKSDRCLCVLPLYHINALVVNILTPLLSGAAVIIDCKFSASQFWPRVEKFGCTWINAVPTIISYLINDEKPSTVNGSQIRFCRSASAALAPFHHKAFEERFGIGIIETMGMTETAAPIFSNPYDPAQRKIGSIGRPSGVQARVIDKQGNDLGPGEKGEILVKGDNVMLGYYKSTEQTQKAFTEDGWLRTGDLGYRDADGFYFITGRVKELIIKGGENIAPREIDEILLAHPDVLDAAVVGIDDKHYGQNIAAYIVKRMPARNDDELIQDINQFCLKELGSYKSPAAFRFVTELPRGPSGKVQRLKLLEL
ncbi:long-chain fatty acid--CoA ligase [Advenella sp. S44]|uniref:AMP-binding protein n=1 Tax=Advenella sp. S44 TaxID=1982755 RepID=UPI000C29AD90|nr:AMP-binding protein [Advenella sp. S44]PJX25244.1 long-chain fatty acid--CoA ligase [Advenella sp. S44]